MFRPTPLPLCLSPFPLHPIPPVWTDYSTVGYSLLLKPEKMLRVESNRVTLGSGPTFGCIVMADFLEALAKRVQPNDTGERRSGWGSGAAGAFAASALLHTCSAQACSAVLRRRYRILRGGPCSLVRYTIYGVFRARRVSVTAIALTSTP